MTNPLPSVISVENPEHRLVESVFLPAFLEDNPILEERDPGYRERLYQQGERLAEALLKGNWSVFAGQFLSEFAYHRHVIKPFEIPRKWTRFRGYDWGFAAPACMIWFAKDPATGRIYAYQEFYEMGMTDPQQAEAINDMTNKYERFAYSYADPSVWTKRSTQVIAKSTFDVFQEHGILLSKADNNQERKAKGLRSALADIHDGLPGIQFFDTLKMTIMEIEGLMTNPDKPEVPATGQADHAYDALCYGLTRYTPPIITGFKKHTTKYQPPFEGVEGL